EHDQISAVFGEQTAQFLQLTGADEPARVRPFAPARQHGEPFDIRRAHEIFELRDLFAFVELRKADMHEHSALSVVRSFEKDSYQLRAGRRRRVRARTVATMYSVPIAPGRTARVEGDC